MNKWGQGVEHPTTIRRRRKGNCDKEEDTWDGEEDEDEWGWDDKEEEQKQQGG